MVAYTTCGKLSRAVCDVSYTENKLIRAGIYVHQVNVRTEQEEMIENLLNKLMDE